jgi:hypothetical protein
VTLRERTVAPPKSAHITAEERAAIQREIARFKAFYDAYSDLVELICDAAQIGLEPWMEEKYSSYRLAFAEICVRSEFAISADFDALFLPYTLEEHLKTDEGQRISCLSRTSAAVTHWQDELSERLYLAGLLND